MWVTPPFCQAYPSTHSQTKADLYPTWMALLSHNSGCPEVYLLCVWAHVFIYTLYQATIPSVVPIRDLK